MRRLAPLLLASLALIAAGCGDDDADGGATTAAADGTSTVTAQGCRAVPPAEPKAVDLGRPRERLPRGADVTVTLETNCGAIPIRLDTGRQPRTAASFAHLAREGVFDGLGFHRVVPGFVVQGGDPAGDGTGGPGYTIRETPPADAAYTRGVVAMAKTEIERPGTSGSQFFIVTAEDAQLPPDYAIVGEVTGDGMRVVDRIEAVPTDGETPTEPVVIERATVTEG